MDTKMKDKKSNRDIIKLFWELSKPYARRRTLALLAALIIFIIGMFVGPMIIARLLDMIQNGRLDDTGALWQLVIVYGLAQLWSEILGWRLVLYLIWTFEVSAMRDLYGKIFDKLSGETLFFHSSKFGGSLVSQTNKITGAFERFWDTIIWSIMPVIVSVTGSIIVLSTLLWQYAVFLAIFAVIFTVVVYFGSKPMLKLNEAEAKTSNKISGKIADSISNILAVKSSGAEKRESTEFRETVGKWRSASFALMLGFLKVSTVYSTINTTIKVGAVAFAVYAAQHNTVSVAAIYLIVTYTNTMARELWNINGIMRNYNRIMGDAREMADILATPTTLIDKSDSQLKVAKGAICVDNITFTHDEGAGKTLFRNFSLDIKPGEKVGLVGASGSGKTTLTKLLLRFSDISDGQITIDGQNIADVAQASLRSNIAYVPQEPLLFHRSIRENIAYARPDASDDEIEAAAKKAGAYDFVVDLQDGFDTLVGERGVKLSGGQRQRIAIARAILKDAPILLLDEATSALDSESEKLIQKSLATLMKNRTSIVIAHRLSTIAVLDRIIVMEHGAIIEDGTHEELLGKKRGAYARLWKHQSGGFIEE